MKQNVFAAAYTIFALTVFVWGYTVFVCANNISPLDRIIKDGNPTQALLRLFAATGIEYNGSLQEVVDATQKAWLRPAGKERWEIDHSEFSNSDEVWNLFEEMHLVQRAEAKQKEYEYLLVLGATYSSVTSRLKQSIESWNQGVRWKECVLFGSARPLVYDKEIELIMKEYGIAQDQCPKTEAEMMKYLYETIDLPDEMRACKLTIIDVPMLDNGKGGMRRATTQDTIDWWLNEQPQSGSCLVISSQPFIAYQYSVLITYIPKKFSIEVIGQGAPGKGASEIGTYFDTLARLLYQENLRINMQ